MRPFLGIRPSLALGLALFALAIVACGCSSTSDSSTVVLPGKEGRPDVSVPTGRPPSKLVVVDLEKGDGRVAERGSELSVRYFLLAYGDHSIKEDHWRDAPISFTLGAGNVDPFWEKGLLGIKSGGRRELITPSRKTLIKEDPAIYVLEVNSVTPPKPIPGIPEPTERITPTGSKPAIDAVSGAPPNELVVRELKKGTGGRVRQGERVGVRFMSFNYKTKWVQHFWRGGKHGAAPYSFILGSGSVRKGWEIAIPGKRLGTRLELLLPSRLAYRKGPMRYVVELIEREKPKPKPSPEG